MPTDNLNFPITFEHVLDLHEEIIEASGGRSGILNEAGLHSALARPYSGYYETLDDKISALVESFVQNHGFVDGNKRTAVMLAHLLIYAHFHELQPINQSDDIDLGLEDLVVELAKSNIGREDVRLWFKLRLNPLLPLHPSATSV